MSAYVRFVLDRAAVPPPTRIVVMTHREEWANRQIADELRSILPAATVTFETAPTVTSADLLIVPFLDDFLTETVQPVLGSDAQRLWVMLYGLRRRSITLLQGPQLATRYRRYRRTRSVLSVLARLRLSFVLRRTARWWLAG